MTFDRRMMALFVVLAVLGLPAFTMRVLCVGRSCDEPVEASAQVPFCRLPDQVRSPLAAGFREGRSPDVLAVASEVDVAGGQAFGRKGPQPGWPSVDPIPREVPLVLHGSGLPTGELEGDIGSDDIAPTLAALMGIERPHPEVRSGTAVASVPALEPAPLVVEIVWKSIGSKELKADPSAWPQLDALADEGMSTLGARVPSLPLDPAAVLTTIGTGGTPAQHAITGTLVRNDEGQVIPAWSADAPVSVIAGLGDDLDQLTRQEAQIGLIADAPTDRGLIGKDWYVDTDRDDVVIARTSEEVLGRTLSLLNDGYGLDGTPDLLAFTLSGSIARMDRLTAEIVTQVRKVVPDSAVVVTATGSPASDLALDGEEVRRQVESAVDADGKIITATAPGGLFLDQSVVARDKVSDDEIIEALSQVGNGQGTRAFVDVFPAIAVSFGRYC